MKPKKKNQIPFKQVVSDLLDYSKPFPPIHLHRFSDLDPSDLAILRIEWPKVITERRVSLMQDLEDLSDSDTLVLFDELARFTLEDPDARVRAIAIRLLWETEDSKLIPLFIRLMKTDPDDVVRAGAAGGLGLFVYLGEVETIAKDKLAEVETALSKVYHSQDKPLVRRRALESLGYSSREEVPSLLREALNSQDSEWQASALFAMGRSADEQWAGEILAHLEDSDPELRLEAVRAAGALGLSDAREPLLAMIEEQTEGDDDQIPAAIWSLSQIGGEGVLAALQKLLEEVEDDDSTEFIEDALENLDFTNGSGSYGSFDLEALHGKGELEEIDLLEQAEEDAEENDLLYGSKN